ncbi:MAG TPA: extracellular solute-binding protein [Ruminiclostridium sp.]
MNKKLITKLGCTLVSLIMVTSLMTACGSSSSNSAATTTAVATATAAPAAEVKPADLKGTATIWDWDEAFGKGMGPEFNKTYPNIKINFVTINHDDYMQKLQSSIAAGTDVPDILLGEGAWRGKMFDMNISDNLESAPYNVNKADMLDYVIPSLTNSKGELVGVDQGAAPAGFAYRRDLAKKYLGTDDPDQLSALLKDWDSFITKGKEVVKSSGGKVFMMAGLGDAEIAVSGENSQSFVTGDTIDLTARFTNTYNTLFKIRDAGILGKTELYSPAWNNAFSKGETIFFNCASWGPKWHVSANDKDGSGRWGLVVAPGGGYTFGGTSIGIYKDSKNKEAAWTYVKFAYFSKEGGAFNYKTFGNVPGYKPFFDGTDSPMNSAGPQDAFFGGENLLKVFYSQIMPVCKSEPQTKYTTTVATAEGKLIPLFMKDTSIDATKALQMLIAEVKLQAKDAEVK